MSYLLSLSLNYIYWRMFLSYKLVMSFLELHVVVNFSAKMRRKCIALKDEPFLPA